MAGNGHARRDRHDGHVPEDAAGDRSLFHKQHPSTPPPPRFSSPSRPRRRAPADNGFKSVAFWAAVATWLQGVVWVMLSVLAIALYYGFIGEDVGQQWDDWTSILVHLYFKDAPLPPNLPEEGLVSRTQMFHFAVATLVANALMWSLSFTLMLRVGCCSGCTTPRALLVAVVMWALSVLVVTTVDVVVAAAMVRDLVLLESCERDWLGVGDFAMLRLCPGAVLIVALRGGLLLLANVACMLLVLHRLNGQRKGTSAAATHASQPATKAEGPIDGFLYRNSGAREGVHNPVFVQDDDVQQPPWKTFRPELEGQRDSQGHDGGKHANGHGGHDLRYSSRDDPDDISSHLMWMEEVDKHVDVRVRRGHAEDRPPQHHRYGLVEDRAPQYHRHGLIEDRRADERFPSGRLRGALGAPTAGPLPAGYPAPGQGLRLSRAALAETPFQFPVLPPVDYSPPTRRSRAHGAHGAQGAAYAAGRAGLRPVRQDRHDRY